MNPEPPFRLEPPVLENLHEGRRLPKSEQPAATPQQATSADAPFEYTILVAYTEAAKRTEGDSSAVEAVAQLVVDETNESYRNSDLALRTRLAHVYEEPHYTEGTIFQDLNRLRNINDGFLDDVHVYRNRYHADVVVLFVDQVSGYGGVATLLASQATAFAVVASPAAASDSVSAFAHEIGHLQGAHHNREQSLNGFFPYGHGYCDQRHGWRTVMAYAIFAQRNGSQVNLCPDNILQWSNPDVTFDGDSTGPNRAVTNNARVLRETANKIAKFRTSIPVSSSLIEGSFGIPYGNFEIVVWDESELIHFFRDNNRAGLPWIRGQTFAQRIRSTPSLIQGTFGRDFSGDFSNFEVVVREGRFLRHYFRDNNLPDLPWEEGVLFGNNVSSAPALIQSSFGSPHGNYEVVVREGRSLRHYYRDNNDPSLPWYQGELFGDGIDSAPAFMQSSFGEPYGNFEVLVREDDALRHYFRDNNQSGTPWHIGERFGSGVASAPKMIESDFGEPHGNFEVVVREGDALRHYYRDNSAPEPRWRKGVLFGDDVRGLIGLIQSSRGRPHGNFEVVVREGDGFRHYYRANNAPDTPWRRGELFQ